MDAESVAGYSSRLGTVLAVPGGHPGVLFPDDMFVHLLPSGRGRSSVPVKVTASGDCVAATLYGLSDSETNSLVETTDAVTFDLRRKVAAGRPVMKRGVRRDDVDVLAAAAGGKKRSEPDPSMRWQKVIAETGRRRRGGTRRALDLDLCR